MSTLKAEWMEEWVGWLLEKEGTRRDCCQGDGQ